MTLIHFVDENGVHWVYNLAQFQYATVNVVDGSQPVAVFFAGRNQPFMMTLTEFVALAGAIPTAVPVTT